MKAIDRQMNHMDKILYDLKSAKLRENYSYDFVSYSKMN